MNFFNLLVILQPMALKETKNQTAIIVPVFNEEKIISAVLDDLLLEAKKLKADIFVINDGSTDNTLKALRTYQTKVSVISYRQNRGKGYALRIGTDKVHTKYEIIAWIDGDGQLVASDISKMIAALTDDTDMIISKRSINFKVLPTSKIGRETVSFLFNFLFKSKITDHLSGLRVFRSSAYPAFRWTSDDYRIEVESLARAVINNLKYKEIRTVCKKKLYRGIGWQDGLKIYYWIFWCFFNRRKLYCPLNKDEDYAKLLISKSPVRAFIRKRFYISNILRFIQGKTLDFGCGVGEVLKYLPKGSVGLDPNKASVNYCKGKNLQVEMYDPEKFKYSLNDYKMLGMKTLLMNHVLEHINSPQEVLAKILREANKLNLSRVIIVVPCKKGFDSDKTHVKYIDEDFFEKKIKESGDFRIIHKKFYPIDNVLIGNYFRYQELVIVYERVVK